MMKKANGWGGIAIAAGILVVFLSVFFSQMGRAYKVMDEHGSRIVACEKADAGQDATLKSIDERLRRIEKKLDEALKNSR